MAEKSKKSGSDKEVQVKFLTKLEGVGVADTPFTVPAVINSDGLNTLVRELLGNTEDESLLLESQLAELTDKLDRMEEEMVILSEESSNLQQALEIKESVILDQVSQYYIHHES